MYFFRLHNLRKAEEDKKKKQQEQRRRRRSARSGSRTVLCHRYTNAALTLAPSRLFERTPLTPSDSLDEVALQIPRWSLIVNIMTVFLNISFSIMVKHLNKVKLDLTQLEEILKFCGNEVSYTNGNLTRFSDYEITILEIAQIRQFLIQKENFFHFFNCFNS